jgi:hypothetical protein
MPPSLRRTIRTGAIALSAVLVAGLLYTMFVYRSINIFAPPDRLESLGRTYLLSKNGDYSREELDLRQRQLSDHYTLELVDYLPPRHPIYQFQNDAIRGHATTSAYLKWGNRYISYQLSGGP